MGIVLTACLIAYLSRYAIERTDRSMQGFKQKTYVKYIQGHAAAVIVAAISGYGINSLTGGASGLLGYAGFLMALPLPLAMVFFSGIRQARDAEFEEQWPPLSVPTDRVQVRHVLGRVNADAKSTAANPEHLEAALRILLDKSLPAVREHGDRSLRRWLRDHPYGVTAGAIWAAGTVSCAALAVLPDLGEGEWALLRVPIVIALLVALFQFGTVVTLWRRSQFRYRSLAQQLETEAGGLRRRRTEEQLGIRA